MSVQVKPRGNLEGFRKYFKSDLLSGFMVFLIALPLCMGIALASGFPAIAGIFTAIIGSLIPTIISDSELTIKGPAAGLIVIMYGCIETFGGDGVAGGFLANDMSAYRMTLAVACVAAVLQIIFGLIRGGILVEIFPLAAVHGMLAAIGVIILVKQLPVVLGVSGGGEPLEMIMEIPHYFQNMNPAVALIGFISLLIMFLWPNIQKKSKIFKSSPSPLLVLLIAIPLGKFFGFGTSSTSYEFLGSTYQVGESFLVSMPKKMFGMFDYITYPDFSVFSGSRFSAAAGWTLMFFIIGSLESLLSAKAMDVIDPYKRKTNFNRDVLGVGVANLGSALVGGLPMISEIVRSKANLDNGGKTRFANVWHGVFLLLCVSLLPTVLHMIPLTALAAMLIYTGYRLAHPLEFVHTYKIGPEQLLVFVSTLIGVLATDLLIGVLIGIVVKLMIHLKNGASLSTLFKPDLDVSIVDENNITIKAKNSATFSNWLLFKHRIFQDGLKKGVNVTLDLSHATLVDHSVMEKLHELELDFEEAGLELKLIGLEELEALSFHEYAARKRVTQTLRRVTVIVSEDIGAKVCEAILKRGANGYTTTKGEGVGRHQCSANTDQAPKPVKIIKIESIVPPKLADEIFDYCRDEIAPNYPCTMSIDSVDALKKEHFLESVHS